MSRAGQAGEVGSVFRCVVATHFAVHGIRSRSVLGLDLPSGVDPIRLDFETSEPTDDIRVTFSDGRCAYVSAKRKVTKGRPLMETINGWIGQALALGPDDLLIIAGEEFVGPTKNLDRVLRRHRAGLRMETKEEREAFDALADLLPDKSRELILDRARVLHLPHSTGAGAFRDLLAALMDLAVVDSQGRKAVSTLADLFHRQAGEALGSGIDDWVVALNDDGLTVIAGRDGPAGMRVAARLAAVRTYRDRLRAEAGRIDLSLLADGLPPVVIDNLVEGLKISIKGERTPENLLRYLRRWRRMLIVGQPGSGKSVALREIVAHCVTHSHAPVPIRVSLPRLMKQQPERLTVDGIIYGATADVVGDDQRPSLAEYLAGELADGRAIILCDGLDECGAHASWVAQQLANILGSLHPRTGFVLATRANAQNRAARLGLPIVELAAPQDLDTTVDSVLARCADARVPPGEREAWLATRRAWIRDAKNQHDHLLAVPLLAILLTLICADASDADLPKGRATLLHRAVEQSVQRWEQARETLDPTRPWSPALTTAMLLDGFIVLGRILDGGATPSRLQALGALGELLSDPNRWGMPPAQAREVAEHVLRFWDEHVAVFVVNAADELTTRSKVFAEIATAMWARGCDRKLLKKWLTDALVYTDSDGAIALASGLDPRIIGALLDVGANDHPEAVLMVADLATRGIAALTASELEGTLTQLIAGVVHSADGWQPAQRGPRNPTSQLPALRKKSYIPDLWPFVRAACLLALPAGQRPQRANLITKARLDDRSETIAIALSELTDATVDGRPLGEKGVAAVNAALAIPVPPQPEMVRESRRRYSMVGGSELAPGLAQVALAAADRLDELANESSGRIFQIAKHAPVRDADRIFAALKRAGIDTSRRWAALPDISAWISDHHDYEAALLADLGSLAEPDSSPSGEWWSLSDVGDLLAATGYEKVGTRDFSRAFVHDGAETRRCWLDAIADAYNIDKSAVANQARHLQRMSEELPDGRIASDDWFVVSTRPLVKPSLVANLARALTTEQQRTLLTCLEAASSWIAWASAKVLIEIREPFWDCRELLDKDMTTWPRYRAGLLYLVAILTAGDERRKLLARAAGSDSADHRYAARMTISVAPSLDPDGSMIEALRRDADLSVRPEDTQTATPTPTHWTCNDCRAINNISTEDCVGCNDGARPGA